MKKISDYLGLPSIDLDEKENKFIYVIGRYIGIEKELESMKLSDIPEIIYWNIAEDGSLRNRGIELKFKEPLNNNGIILALKELDSLFKSCFRDLTHSSRTSEHFHVNIRDFTIEELISLHTNLMALEQTLFNLGKIKFDRKHSTYCTPHWVYFSEYQFNIPQDFDGYFTLPKYLSAGFNSKFGTIEFRMFESITRISEILQRVNVLLELVEYSKTFTYSGEELVKFCKKLLPKSYKYISQYIQESHKIEKIKPIYLDYSQSNRLQKSLEKRVTSPSPTTTTTLE
jgi:hypothetical protein